MSAPAPTATGTLAGTPLPHLLVYALDRKLNGTLVLEAPAGGRSAVLFADGAPTKVKTSEPVIYLGRLLLEMGAIDDAAYNRTLVPVAEQRKLHGQVLLSGGLITHEVLTAALAEQVTRQILWMFALPAETAYGYYAGTNFLERWGGTEVARVAPLALLWRGVRSHAELHRVEGTLARFGSTTLRLHRDAQLARFKFASGEQAVVDVLRARPQTLAQLVQSGLEDSALIQRLLYTLTLTRHIDVGGPPLGVDGPPPAAEFGGGEGPRRSSSGSRAAVRESPVPLSPRLQNPWSVAPPSVREGASTPPARVSAPPMPATIAASRTATPALRTATPASRISTPVSRTATPPSPASDPGGFRSELQSRAEQIPGQNYYEILGVERTASASAIQMAFFQLAKRWHPDRLGPEHADVRDTATRVFSRMSEAHNMLSDSQKRTEYDELIKNGGGTAQEQEEIQSVLRAATNFRKAEVLLKKNNLGAAEEHALLALQDDPKQADYVALHTWIVSLKPDRSGQPLDDLVNKLNQCVSMEPNNLRVRWYRGQLHKRNGKDRLAIRDFRFIVDQDENHLDASREIRLYEMRRGNRPSSAPPPGQSVRPGDSRAPQSAGRKSPEKGGIFGKLFKR